MTDFKRIEDAGDLTGKVALTRVDFNVPMADGKITDDTRLVAAVETVNALRGAGAKVALLSHFGRPKGTRDPSMSLKPVAQAFAKVMGHPVSFCEDCKGEDAKAAITALEETGIILLENTRYYAGEEKMIRSSPPTLPNWATYLFPTHFPQLTAPMCLRLVLRTICQPMLAKAWNGS